MDEAIGWLEARRDSSAPFFLYLPLVEPHGTIASPPWFEALYSRFTRGVPEPIPNLGQPTPNTAARGPGEYWANVSHMDFQIGRLLERLETLGLSQDTLVFFTSDNGPVTSDWRHWWETNLYGDTGGLRGRKADLYEGGIRVPAIARWPGRVAPGGESDAVGVGYDLLPTLAALTGFEVPADRAIDGEDLSPLLRGERFERRRPAYWEFDDDQGFRYALRDGRWKLLATADLKRIGLYDLERDRFEVVDRAAEEPQQVARLLETLRTIHAEVEADPLRPRQP